MPFCLVWQQMTIAIVAISGDSCETRYSNTVALWEGLSDKTNNGLPETVSREGTNSRNCQVFVTLEITVLMSGRGQCRSEYSIVCGSVLGYFRPWAIMLNGNLLVSCVYTLFQMLGHCTKSKEYEFQIKHSQLKMFTNLCWKRLRYWYRCFSDYDILNLFCIKAIWP